MAKVTSKLQVTIPKTIADRYGIAPGDEIDFLPAGDAIRVRPTRVHEVGPGLEDRLDRFDRTTERQLERQTPPRLGSPADRGWRRGDLYERGRTR